MFALFGSVYKRTRQDGDADERQLEQQRSGCELHRVHELQQNEMVMVSERQGCRENQAKGCLEMQTNWFQLTHIDRRDEI